MSEPAVKLGQIESGKAGIEVKSESLRSPGLTMGESSELFGIAEEKFNLEPSLVKVKDVEGGQVNISGKQNDVADFAWGAAVNEQGNANLMVRGGSLSPRLRFTICAPIPISSHLLDSVWFCLLTCIGRWLCFLIFFLSFLFPIADPRFLNSKIMSGVLNKNKPDNP